MRSVRVGGAQGFYGDNLRGAVELARTGKVKYLCFDALAELTMAILQKDRQRDPSLGYTKDVVPLMRMLLPMCLPQDIRLITNAGGINPQGAAQAVMQVARELGVHLRIAVVTGDDVLGRFDEWQGFAIEVDGEPGGEPLQRLRDRLLFANAYLGADPIVEALRQDVDLIITGRTTDTSHYLAVAMAEFGWAKDDWDRKAQGIVLGHLMECTTQVTGGNFSGRWWEIEGLDRIGYPVAEVYEDGSFVLTKPEGSGGRVSVDTVKEQLLYEVHDPTQFITPDVIVDFSTVRLEDVGPDRVRVWGARGRPAPPTLKVVMGYPSGFLGEGRLIYTWPDAVPKAKAAAEIIRKRLEQAGIPVRELLTELIGLNAIHGPLATPPDGEPAEVMLRLAIRTDRREDAERVGREFPPLVLGGPPHGTGFGGMLRARELLGMASCLVPRELVEPHVTIRVEEV